MCLKEKSNYKCFGGQQKVYTHDSASLGCTMTFGIYLPAKCETDKLPVIYYLSGLTCTEQNFVTKAGAQRYASLHNVCLVAPDTSPRGCNIAGEDKSYDLGTGAGFYVDARQKPWSKNYQMYTYVRYELPALIENNFPVIPDKKAIMGHSMGGHGALCLYLKNPGVYSSVSAFAPICAPVLCPWGKNAFSAYLGDDKQLWKEYDASCLMKSYSGPKQEILIDQGKNDEFFDAKQLLPDIFLKACDEREVPCMVRLQEGYDHSYYFIASFVGEHIAFHANRLRSSK